MTARKTANKEVLPTPKEIDLREFVYKKLQDYRAAKSMLESPLGANFSQNGIAITNVKTARQDFDYDTDSGEQTEAVIKFSNPRTDETIFVALKATYQSYEGVQLDRWDFVVPKQVQKIDYVTEL